MKAHLISVNTGTIAEVTWGRVKRSAIDKHPVEGPVGVSRLGLAGDEIADLTYHGGVDQAVYAYAREDLDAWEVELDRDLVNGQFGENLTTCGIDIQNASMGDRWRIGTTLLEVCDVRIPCSVFAGFLGEKRWVRRFAEKGVPGAYLRVIEEGQVAAGDDIVVEMHRDLGLTVELAFRARMTEPDQLHRFADEPGLGRAFARAVHAYRNHA
ncbi:MOSC domain-containing protein [Aeromicrobium sp. CF3.5]|uniref:MOSC domain-containing protein n=1 Tax=Aeromicrobium sp. CF3.5 TaxID=3373078 RepID=UPI003EE7C736